MATAESLLFKSGLLTKIAATEGLPYLPDSVINPIDTTVKSPGIVNGQLWFGLKDNENITIGGTQYLNNRAYMFLDRNGERYAISGPVIWDDIYNIPSLVPYNGITINQDNNYQIDITAWDDTTAKITTTDYYIGALGDWTANASIELQKYKNGSKLNSGHLTLSLPLASSTQYGIITTGAQTFSGNKTFQDTTSVQTKLNVGTLDQENTEIITSIHGGIGLGAHDNIKIYFNHDTESLDFTFL